MEAGHRQPVVLYDSDCGFCRWSLAKLLAWDRRGRLRPVPIQSAEGTALLSDLASEDRLGSWHLVDSGGERLSGGAAAPRVLRELPGGGAPATVLARFPRLTERAYRWVVRHRTPLGRPLTAGAKRRADERIRRAAARPAG